MARKTNAPMKMPEPAGTIVGLLGPGCGSGFGASAAGDVPGAPSSKPGGAVSPAAMACRRSPSLGEPTISFAMPRMPAVHLRGMGARGAAGLRCHPVRNRARARCAGAAATCARHMVSHTSRSRPRGMPAEGPGL